VLASRTEALTETLGTGLSKMGETMKSGVSAIAEMGVGGMANMISGMTEALVQRTLVLPTGANVEPADIEGIGALLRFAHDHAAAIRTRAAGGGDLMAVVES